MNNTFNWQRFTMVLRKDMQGLSRQFIQLAIIIAAAFLIIFVYTLVFGKGYDTYNNIRLAVITGIFIGVTFTAPFQLYKRYNHKIYGVNYFMLPASLTEKWFSMWFYCGIVTPLFIVLASTVTDCCLYPFYTWTEKALWFSFALPSVLPKGLLTLDVIISFFAVQSLLFLGNAWFQRAKVQKTVIGIIIFSAVYAMFISVLLSSAISIFNFDLIADISPTPDDSQITANLSINTDYIPTTGLMILKFISCLIAPVGLWFVSFLKMKEQQL
ncbi:MAG: hypothetical protein LBV41_02035 [Cytophagaceae bacterium]|jgi:hypothetical protein|nr:hypothetical protein [Cytophagaceae bacterium]